MLPPGLDRIGLVEPDGRRDRVPEPLDVRLAEDDARPLLARVRDDRPVARPGSEPQARFRQLPHACVCDSLSVEVGKEPGLGAAADHEQRPAVGAEILQALHEPGRRPAERVVGGVLDMRPANPLVCVVDVHVGGSSLVRRGCDRADERGMLDVSVHGETLSRLKIDPDLDGQPGVGGEHLLELHGTSMYVRRLPPWSLDCAAWGACG